MANRKPALLVVDDDSQFTALLARGLAADYEVRSAASEAEAVVSISPPPDVVLLDIRLRDADPGSREGLRLLEMFHKQYPKLPILMATAFGDIDTAVEAMRLGASDFIQKRAGVREIKSRLDHALDHARLSRRYSELENDFKLIEPRRIVGNSAAISDVKLMIEAVASEGGVTVLIRGETGTGKELVARAIHATGPRQGGPFVAVNLAALPKHTLESELFGHERGAFTDAREKRIGYFEQAHTGVLLLDEIGEIDTSVQVKILRFLEERQFHRLGGSKPIVVDVQVLTATNADLESRVRDGSFRQDLYFRLKVHQIDIPPLRHRREDIPLLVEHYMGILQKQGRKVLRVSSQAMDLLMIASWPGNIRELKNAIESAVFRAQMRGHEEVEAADLPSDLIEPPNSAIPKLRAFEFQRGDLGVEETLAWTELSLIDEAMRRTGGKKAEASRLLKYNDRFALYRRIRTLSRTFPQLMDRLPGLRTAFAVDQQTAPADEN